MDTFAIATVVGGTNPQYLPQPEPAQVTTPPQEATPLPQQATSAQQSAALPEQAPPRPVEDSEQSTRKETRQQDSADSQSATRNQAEGKGLRLDMQV